ncbi:hypothetical protein [Modestobacter sp. Leaf380]|uniref:hypothetical protein n=1 Tax=Modestobacter sp. Leaf380 TaxID=1736356 RepID=UPI0006F8BC26|nr:hypothetical protein [Modestobacter sp. Leaf380]KQS69374.1 hypothetical protein ASG41_21555 [Modestobacter sp. Leaf380]
MSLRLRRPLTVLVTGLAVLTAGGTLTACGGGVADSVEEQQEEQQDDQEDQQDDQQDDQEDQQDDQDDDD